MFSSKRRLRTTEEPQHSFGLCMPIFIFKVTLIAFLFNDWLVFLCRFMATHPGFQWSIFVVIMFSMSVFPPQQYWYLNSILCSLSVLSQMKVILRPALPWFAKRDLLEGDQESSCLSNRRKVGAKVSHRTPFYDKCVYQTCVTPSKSISLADQSFFCSCY